MKKDIRDVADKLNRDAGRRKKKLEYLREYRRKKASEIAARRKELYHSDPEYRRKCIERAKAAYARRKELLAKAEKDSAFAERHAVCPFCRRPMPRPRRAVRMKVAGKYEVAMFPIGELARRVGKSVRTIVSWITAGYAPDSRFKTKAGRRMWTQDEIEAYMDVCGAFDLRPPVSLEKSGFVKALKSRLSELEHGIRPELYTVRTPEGLLRRESQDLPAPARKKR